MRSQKVHGVFLVAMIVVALGAAPTHAQTCGDCNLDGAISVLDAFAAAADTVGLMPLQPGAFPYCDVDTSGAVNVVDAFMLAWVSVGGPITLVCAQVDIDADTDRSGSISAGPADDFGEETWSTSSGAVFIYNGDDDNLDGNLDHLNSAVDTSFDESDLARIVARSFIAPPGATAVLSIETAAATTRVRLFRKTAPTTWIVATAPYSFPAADLASADVTFAIEGRAMRSPSWDGRVRLRFRVMDGAAEVGRDEIEMRCSPVILQDNTRPGTKVHAVNITSPGAAPNQPYIQAFQTTLTTLGIPWLWANEFTVGFDRWEQDNMQCGYQSMPGVGGGIHQPWSFIQANRNGGPSSLYPYLEDQLVSRDFGMADPGASFASSLNSHGNLEVAPPHDNGTQVFPLGRVVLGGGSNPAVGGGPLITRYMDTVHRNFFNAQETQGPYLEISTEWLIVGHADEYLSFMPNLNPGRPWKLGFASVDLARNNLIALQSAGRGGLTVFAGRTYQTTVNGILGDTSLMAFNTAAQTRLNSIRTFLKSSLGITESDIIDLPVLFEPYNQGGVNYAVAYNPGVVNIQIVSNTLFVPDPEGPHDMGIDVWMQTTENALLSGLGAVNTVYVDCFTSYHELLGEVHCGSNVELTPYTLNWWEY